MGKDIIKEKIVLGDNDKEDIKQLQNNIWYNDKTLWMLRNSLKSNKSFRIIFILINVIEIGLISNRLYMGIETGPFEFILYALLGIVLPAYQIGNITERNHRIKKDIKVCRNMDKLFKKSIDRIRGETNE